MANWKETFRLYNGTSLYTGQAANLSFRVSPYSTDIAGLTFSETPASSGNYVCTGFTAYHKDAKLYLSAVEQTSWGIRNIGDPEDNFVSMSDTSAQSVESRVDFKHATGLRTNVISEYTAGNGVVIDSLQVLDGRIEGSSPIKANSIIEYTGASGVTVDGVLLKDDIYIGHTGRALLAEANVLIVDANRSTDITGYVYNTIQEAIDYAQSQTPSTTSRWTIYIVPHKNTASYAGYAEALTLYKYIDLIGLGGFAMLKAYIVFSGTWTGGTFARLKNIVMRPAVDTGLTLRGLECDNCHFGIEEDSSTPTLSLENSQFTNCGFWKFGTVTNAIATTGSNYIMNCQGNSAVTWDASDLVWGYDYINDASKYFKLT